MATGFSRLLAAILILAAVRPAAAQDQLQYDAQQRVFTMTYVDDEGVTRQVVIVPPNHIEPAMSVTVAGSPDGLRYAYTLANHIGPLSTQPILRFDIPCPGSEGNVAVESPKSWSGEHRFHGGLQRFTCMFDAYTPEADVQPGDSTTGFVISSSFLPDIGTARIWGVRPEPPTLEGLVEVGPELAGLKGKATGSLGGWFELRVVRPGRSPTELSDPAQGVQAVIADLGEGCELGWVDQEAVCLSLRVKLDASAAALAQGDIDVATDALRDFLAELEDQHGSPPGKHVNDNAYWLLKTNAEFVLSKLWAPGPGRRGSRQMAQRINDPLRAHFNNELPEPPATNQLTFRGTSLSHP